MPSGYTLKRFNDELVIGMTPTQVISGTFPTVAGVSACETVFKTKDFQARFVCLEKNGELYNILCTAPPEVFDKTQTSFDMIINSFKVQ